MAAASTFYLRFAGCLCCCSWECASPAGVSEGDVSAGDTRSHSAPKSGSEAAARTRLHSPVCWGDRRANGYRKTISKLSGFVSPPCLPDRSPISKLFGFVSQNYLVLYFCCISWSGAKPSKSIIKPWVSRNVFRHVSQLYLIIPGRNLGCPWKRPF